MYACAGTHVQAGYALHQTTRFKLTEKVTQKLL